jgi:hypothetical protein
MALVAIHGGLLIPRSPIGFTTSPSFLTSALAVDAADEGVAFVVAAPKTGMIAKVGWATRTVTTGATIDVRLETLDTSGAAPARPSGTLWGTNTAGSQVVAAADDNVWFLTSLTAAATVTKGDRLAVVIKNPTASFGNMQISGFQDDADSAFPYCLLNTGVSPATSWAGVTGAPIMAFEYSDGTYAPIPGVYPIRGTITSQTLSTGTTPDVYGMRFRLPFPARSPAAWAWIDADGDLAVKLVSTAYHQANNTGVLGTATLHRNVRVNSNPGIQWADFDAAVTLAANTDYRLVVEPTSATSLTAYDFDVNTLDLLDAHSGGRDFHLTTAKDPTADGDWTNYNAGTFRKPFLGIMLDAFDDGTGGGGGGTVYVPNAGGYTGIWRG